MVNKLLKGLAGIFRIEEPNGRLREPRKYSLSGLENHGKGHHAHIIIYDEGRNKKTNYVVTRDKSKPYVFRKEDEPGCTLAGINLDEEAVRISGEISRRVKDQLAEWPGKGYLPKPRDGAYRLLIRLNGHEQNGQ